MFKFAFIKLCNICILKYDIGLEKQIWVKNDPERNQMKAPHYIYHLQMFFLEIVSRFMILII